MLTSTLGGLIKDYRIKKRLSQLDVSLKIGWKDTTRLSKIEQGRVARPTRKTLDKIISALDLDESERGQILLSSGIIPDISEARSVLSKLKARIDEFNCPLILVDFAWNIIFVNGLGRELFHISDEQYLYIEKNYPNWLEIVFIEKFFTNVEIRGGFSEKKLLPFHEFEIAHFKFEHSSNSNERWYRNLLTRVSKESVFREKWNTVQKFSKDHLLYEYEVDEFIGVWKGKKQKLKFHIFSVHPTFDFRFYLMIHSPANSRAYAFCK